jgi:soluble lytic murein transglycosylase
LQEAARQVEAESLAAAIELLISLEGRSAPSAIRRQADLLLGILLVRQEDMDRAVPYLERAAANYPLLADYALYNLARAHRRAGRRSAAALSLQRLVEQHPESLFVERARRELPREWFEAGDLSQAEAAAGSYLGSFPQGPGRAAVWLTLAGVLLRSGRTAQAEEVLRRIWVELPGNSESQPAKELLATIPGARPFTPDEEFQRAMTLHQLGRYGQARPELAPFAVSGHPREVQARLLLGMGAFNLRQYAEAIQWLEPLSLMGDRAGADRGEALYWFARGLGRSGNFDRFRETLILLADLAPRTRRAEEALYLLAKTAADRAEVGAARAFLSRLLREYPRGGWTDSALWLQGWLAYKDGDAGTAFTAWARLLAEEPGSPLRTPSLYWQGRALELLGQPKEAAQVYQAILQTAPDQHYYRLRAAEGLARLGKKAARPAAVAAVARKPPVEGSTFQAKKARALRTLGLNTDALEEYSEQVRSHPEDLGGLAEACRAFVDLERYDKAVQLAGRVVRSLIVQSNGQLPVPQFWQCLYPLGHWPLVRDQAIQQGLDPYLVTALIREESAFAQRAVSGAGARGLMQLMPQTAEQVARQHKVALPALPPLEAPEVNVRLGTIHLADLVRDYGGNLALALASYNAGSHWVRRWRERWGLTEDDVFIEDIPFPETRAYVKRVLGSYERYSSLYGQKRGERREPRAESRGRRARKR